jgi:hypothetical protein
LPAASAAGFTGGLFGPVGVAGTTLHDLRRDAKSISRTPPDLGKHPNGCICAGLGTTEAPAWWPGLR